MNRYTNQQVFPQGNDSYLLGSQSKVCDEVYLASAGQSHDAYCRSSSDKRKIPGLAPGWF